jgi:hypothetical protein
MPKTALRTLPLLLLLACDGGKTPDPGSEETDESDSPRPEDTFRETDDPTVPDGPLVLTGLVRDGAGNPITSGVRVQYCRGDACISAHEYDAGTYSFYDVEAGVGSFEVVNTSETARRPNIFVPITVNAETRTLDVVLPDLGPEAALPGTAGWVTAADGLQLQVVAGDLTPASPFEPEVTAIAGSKVVSEALPVEGVSGDLLAMFYLWPFDATSAASMAVRLDPATLSDPPLMSGHAELWYADYETSAWISLGDLTDDGMGQLTTATPLPKLTTLLVVEKAM